MTHENLTTSLGAKKAVVSSHWHEGSEGAIALAKAVVSACENNDPLKFLYRDHQTLKEKIETISREIYGAEGVEYSELAEKQLQQFTTQG